MKRVCAWCGAALGNEDTADSKVVTHGICAPCLRAMYGDSVSETLRSFLNKFEFPVLQVDKDGRIMLTNDKVNAMLRKSPEEVDGKLGGDVIECVYSKEPGGCGKTVHCKGCAIRNTVMASHDTGESFSNIDAYQDIQTNEGVKRVHFKISTEKILDVVLLKVEPAE